jgi:sulfate/thiosulfate transport system ATP-binding protein
LSIVLDQLVKRYGGHSVVNHVSLEVADGEFFVLLGPSGSGKSTVLRMIAGLADVDGGRILLHGRDVTRVPPQRRGIGLVFQNYALFRHMTVAQNIEFPLRIRKVKAAERRSRREELLELVGLSGLGTRLPQQLSGGQQQRVALARALAHRPEVLLLDEPFGALDARIRVELRRTVRTIQRELGVTTIFVTHDQDEAFELADRLGVMNIGKLLEVGTPDELYLHPQTEFVATFLGTANLMVGECAPDGVRLGHVHFPLNTQAAAVGGTRRVQVLFRPEDVAVKTTPEALGWPLLGEAVVDESEFVGSYERLRLRMPKLAGVRPIAPPAPFGGDFLRIEATRSQHQARRYPLREGDAAWVGVRRVHALTHPGMSFLVLTDGSPQSRVALEMGGHIARLAHARVTLLGYEMADSLNEPRLQQAREWLGSGLASFESRPSPDSAEVALADGTARRHYDLVVHLLPPRGRVEMAERLLEAGEHNLLLIPAAGPAPTRALICVAVGEPAKEDVLFAGRLVRHLGGQATILTVLPDPSDPPTLRHAERFLAAGARTLSLLGVTGRTAIRHGAVPEAILAELAENQHDLLVLGAPLADRRGRLALGGPFGEVLDGARERPVLIVRPSEEESWRF